MNIRPKVLIVDDDPMVLSAIRRTLERVPAVIWTATSAEEALGLLDTTPMDLLISDHQMGGGMTGAMFLVQVHTLLPGARLVLHTGTPPSGPNPIFEVWPKPVQPSQLRQLVEDVATHLGSVSA